MASLASKSGKLDFRFADEEDALDISTLVNAAHAREEVGKGGEDSFRIGPRIDLDKLRIELDNARDLKWLLLETALPDEIMIAVVAVKVNRQSRGGSRSASLRCLSVLSSHQKQGLGANLLRRAEGTCRGLGCSECQIDVMMRRPKLIAWLGAQGYKNLGGGSWVGDAYEGEAVPYTTLVKDLTKEHSAGTGATALAKASVAPATLSPAHPAPPDALLSFTAALADAFKDMPTSADSAATPSTRTENTAASAAAAAAAVTTARVEPKVKEGGATSTTNGTGEMSANAAEMPPPTSTESSPTEPLSTGNTSKSHANGNQGGNLEDLLGTLMSQLETPSGREQFDGLVAAQENNVLGERLDPAMFDLGDSEFEVLEVGVSAKPLG